MELSELTAYAAEKYQIQEQHKWADFPGFSVLCHPKTGKWIALLMRGWDGDTGTEIECCDIKCGYESIRRLSRPYLSPPVRMHSGRWACVRFDSRTEKEVVFSLFDKAFSLENPSGYTITLASQMPAGEGAYKDTALPFSGRTAVPPKETAPERLRQMRHLYEYGSNSAASRAANFYKQAVFMKDYEDNVPWSGNFTCYYPTYSELTTNQLRGYFTWRAQVRQGKFKRIAASAAYIYIYELLNGIGADSPQECLQRLREFETGYLDSGIGDSRMRQNLRRWMLEFAVLHDLPSETARRYADSEMIERDTALAVLKDAASYDDETVFAALCTLDTKKLEQSPVIAMEPERGRRLFSNVWRAAQAYHFGPVDIFTLCFGEKKTRPWYPMSNAVYYEQEGHKDTDYFLDECRSYKCRDGAWKVVCYEKLSFDRTRFHGLLHETDVRLRRYLKTGRYLKENPQDEWILPVIESVMEEDQKALIEAQRPRITIDFSGLEQIRLDAEGTRDRLLTEEERREMGEASGLSFEEEQEETQTQGLFITGQKPEEMGAEAETEDDRGSFELPLDGVQIRILRELLRGGDAADILKANHLMPTITADIINESLFDEIGDTVLVCEEDRLKLVEDYTEDLEELLEGAIHG